MLMGYHVRNDKNPIFRSLALLACLSGPALADDVPKYAEETLTGDWGGTRSALDAAGVVVDASYRWDMLRVASGGIRRGGRPVSHFDVKVKGDLEKVAGWEGATAYVNLIYDGGGKTNRDFLGSQLGITNTEVAVSTSRFFHAWIEKAFADGQWSLLGGLYPIDSEFQVLESAGLFVQPPYGPTPELSLTRGPSIFNNPAFGLRAKWQSEDRTLYVAGAVLDGVPGDPQRPKGTHIKFNQGDGTMQIAEIGYKPFERGHVFEPSSPEKGVPQEPEIKAHEAREDYAKYAFGLWRYTVRADDLLDVDANGVPERRRSAGWYALAERTLWRWSTGDIAGFARAASTDGNSTALKHSYSAGVRVRGLLPGREDDLFGVAYTRGVTGDKFRAATGATAANAESATEITYRVQANKWLAIQPLVQRYRHPGATTAVGGATVVGVRVDIAL